jgi:hypothetical protein
LTPAQSAPVRLAQAIDAGGLYGDVLPVPAKPPLGYDSKKQGAFIVSLAADQFGSVWVGTQDHGVWRYDARGGEQNRWKQFTTKDGLGDDHAYAIAVDALGRVWVGHLNHGVSVWNGQGWRNYPAPNGPLGERIFALAVSPNDGDVWMATSAGLSRYSIKNNAWSHVTRANGLPSLGATSLAFDRNGTLFVGTQCDGIAISFADTDFKEWQTVRGPRDIPDSDSGDGLPGSMINDLAVGPDNTIYAATTRGLARSGDGGETWKYLRGADWKEKLKGLHKPVAAGTEGRQTRLPREDYISCLAVDERGLLWIGYRQRGYEVRDTSRDRALYTSASDEQKNFPYVSAILPRWDSGPLLGTYNQGLQEAVSFSAPRPKRDLDEAQAANRATPNARAFAPWPTPNKAPGLEELQALLKEARAVPAVGVNAKEPVVVAMSDDWVTQGDWLGRYGRYYARLGAMLQPKDYVWGAGSQKVLYHARIGEHVLPHHPGDSLRYWIHWKATSDRRSLEMTQIYYESRVIRGEVKHETDPAKQQNRQSENDDHGEEYPMTHDGPHIYSTLRVPPGKYFLSLYDFNKDGHSGNNRMRDYRVSIRRYPGSVPMGDLKNVEDWPELSRARIRDFWGGVYKRFVVSGGQTLTIEVNRNYSYNTILAGVFLDELSEEPTPYFRFNAASFETEAKKTQAELASVEAKVVEELWQELERVKKQNLAWWAGESRRIHARLMFWLDEAQAQTPPEDTPQLQKRLGTSYYALALFDKWETMQRKRGLTPARDIEKSLHWDRKLMDETGKGRQLITEFLQARETKR